MSFKEAKNWIKKKRKFKSTLAFELSKEMKDEQSFQFKILSLRLRFDFRKRIFVGILQILILRSVSGNFAKLVVKTAGYSKNNLRTYENLRHSLYFVSASLIWNLFMQSQTFPHHPLGL